MGLTSADIIIIVVSTIFCLATILLIIWEAERQMFVFGLRPSESVSTDMTGAITLSKGLAGKVELEYTGITKDVLYNITIKNKLVCVTSKARYTVTDCSSIAFDVGGGLRWEDVTEFKLGVEKKDDDVKLRKL